jgi:hypothetical protein
VRPLQVNFLELSPEDKILMGLKPFYLGEISEGELLSYLRKIC